MDYKPSAEKWSKKEILGHLTDSGIYNLQRFTEIQFVNKPYPFRKYDQDRLVKANDYQNAETNELIKFWKSINIRIINILKNQEERTLNFQIELEEGSSCDLRFNERLCRSYGTSPKTNNDIELFEMNKLHYSIPVMSLYLKRGNNGFEFN